MVELYDGDNTRNNTQQFAVTSSWNRISLTFAGDTTGAFDDDNALSLYLSFWLHAGSSFTSGSYVANTWGTPTTANRAAGISSFFDSTNRTLEITGLQMEVGDSASDFEHRSFGEELELCKRYYQQVTTGENNGPIALATAYNSSQVSIPIPLRPEMRATPTVDVESGSNYYRFTANANNTNFDDVAKDIATRQAILLYKGSLSGMTGGQAGFFFTKSTSAKLAFAAEL